VSRDVEETGFSVMLTCAVCSSGPKCAKTAYVSKFLATLIQQHSAVSSKGHIFKY
jgi:hypothetical protein